jgi:hypothetical protein
MASYDKITYKIQCNESCLLILFCRIFDFWIKLEYLIMLHWQAITELIASVFSSDPGCLSSQTLVAFTYCVVPIQIFGSLHVKFLDYLHYVFHTFKCHPYFARHLSTRIACSTFQTSTEYWSGPSGTGQGVLLPRFSCWNHERYNNWGLCKEKQYVKPEQGPLVKTGQRAFLIDDTRKRIEFDTAVCTPGSWSSESGPGVHVGDFHRYIGIVIWIHTKTF